MIQGDLYNVRGRIKTIDNDLDLRYDGNGEYTITHKGQYFMKVPHDKLDKRVVDHVREMVYINKHGDPLKEIDKERERKDIQEDKKISDMAENLAKDIRKPLIRDYFY